MTSSVNRFVKTLPGRGGIETREDSLSRISRKCSKSLYRRRTEEDLSLNAGMFVLNESVSTPENLDREQGYSADNLVVCVHFSSDSLKFSQQWPE